ncbi:MAG: hypothetical protein AAFQ87_12645 [Bacteroidota bacterium]
MKTLQNALLLLITCSFFACQSVESIPEASEQSEPPILDLPMQEINSPEEFTAYFVQMGIEKSEIEKVLQSEEVSAYFADGPEANKTENCYSCGTTTSLSAYSLDGFGLGWWGFVMMTYRNAENPFMYASAGTLNPTGFNTYVFGLRPVQTCQYKRGIVDFRSYLQRCPGPYGQELDLYICPQQGSCGLTNHCNTVEILIGEDPRENCN